MPPHLTDEPGCLRPFLRLAVPTLAEHFLYMAVGMVDVMLTGRYLERPHLAAMAFLPYALWLFHELFVVVAIGSVAMVARFVGAREYQLAQRITHQSFVVGAAICVPAVVLCYLGADDLVWLLQLRGESAELATRYLRLVTPVLPFIMVQQVGIACLRGAGEMVSGLLAMVLVNVVNICLAWCLLLGWGPFPKWGWDGLAIAVAVSNVVGSLFVLFALRYSRNGLRIRWALLRPDMPLIRRLLRIGIPGGIDILSIIACQMWFLAIINQLGDLASSAHGVALRIESLAYLPGEAFSVAASTLVGQFLGAKEQARAARTVVIASGISLALLVACGVVFYLAAEPLVGAFLKANRLDVTQVAVPLVRMVAFGMPSLAIVMILSGSLRGAGDTRVPLLISFVGFVLIRIPLAYLLTLPNAAEMRGSLLPYVSSLFGREWSVWILSGGVHGAWLAMIVDLYARCGMVLYRFWHGGWKRIDV